MSIALPDIRSQAGSRPLFLPLLAVAAVALAQAIHRFNSRPLAEVLLTAALIAVLLAVLLPPTWGARLRSRAEALTVAVLGLGLVAQLIELAWSTPALYVRTSRAGRMLLVVAAVAAALVIARELAGRARWPALSLAALLAIFVMLGVWIIFASPDPLVDTVTVHVESLRALGQGLDPYGRTIPNIYGHDGFYGPGHVVNGRVLLGFPYPPLSLLLAAPGHVLGGDFRFACVAAVGLAALLIGTCRPGRVAFAAAAVFLFMPRGLMVIEHGWTEPHVVLMLAATVWCACRASTLTPVALGLLLAVKQYMILAMPLAVLLHTGRAPWRDTGRTWLKAALVAAVVTLPFVFADPAAFWRDVIEFQFHLPFRRDSLSYLVDWASATGQVPPTWPAFVATAIAVALGLWRAPRGPAGFAAALALAALVFFAFNKQAFVNYYAFVVGALCCALAAGTPMPTDEAPQ